MKKIEKIVVVEERAEIPPRMILGLSERQSSDRMHNLRNIAEDVYEVVKPIEFKRGEEFFIQTGGDTPGLSKALLAQIQPEEEAVEKEKIEKKKEESTGMASPPRTGQKKKKKSDKSLPDFGQTLIDPIA